MKFKLRNILSILALGFLLIACNSNTTEQQSEPVAEKEKTVLDILDDLNAKIRNNPDNAALYQERAQFYIEQEEYTQAFKDITSASGAAGTRAWSTGVVMVDINADGWLDIYVCNAGNVEGDDQENESFINNGDNTFTERAEEFGLADNGFTTHAAFFDYDGDGDLDVYMLNNSFIPVTSLGFSNKRE